MSLKDNFNQAVKELLKRDGLVSSDGGKPPKSELDRILETPEDADMAGGPDSGYPQDEGYPAPGAGAPPPAMPENRSPFYSSDVAPIGGNPASSRRYGGGMPPSGGGVPPVSPPQNSSPGAEPPYFETEETTVISRNTIVDGNIRSFANISVEGSVKGNVQITKNANLSGKIVGDLSCNSAVLQGSAMQGNISSKGQVLMDKDSLILGDIAAQYLDMNGKVKGNVEVNGKAEFKADAIIIGNINASTLSVLDGANIQGFVNTTFLQDSAPSVFPDEIAVSD